ncbi:MAG: MFS transporter [Eubacteriales bacterium]|nr:MFS transporter [Eubacteriales bacterium]
MEDAITRKVGRICSLAYFMSYVMRLGFAAGLVEITAALGVSQSSAGLACTGLFITYGAGQFLSGYLGDRIPPRVLITAGMLGAAACNIGVAIAPGVGAMIALWCINGLFQALLWPPMTRLMAETLSPEGYLKASRDVSVAANFATMAVYALMSLFVARRLWQGYFYLSAVLGAAAALVFWFKTKDLSDSVQAPVRLTIRSRTKIAPIALASGLPLIMLAIVMQGMLRDGVTTWMPSLIADTANMGASASVLSAAVLPVFSVVCIDLAARLQRRVPNDTLSSLFLFGVSAAAALVMLPLMGSAVASIACMAVITGCAHAINFLLICHVPSYFAPYGCVSSISGLINSCTYIGSAVSTYGIALLSDACGWQATVALWCAIALLGALLCLSVVRRWRRFVSEGAGRPAA